VSVVKLKAPFPWFGGKSRVASLVWERLGDVDNAIEPFAGSIAFLLARPHPPRIETVNDADCYVANFWRATTRDPEAVAEHADGPVNEADLHARHRWLVLSGEAAMFRERMRTDPEYFDARVAGWWCWGLCCWIGSGWCISPESAGWVQTPKEASGLTGVHTKGQDNRKPRIDGGEGQYGHGVHAKGDVSHKKPRLVTGGPAGGGKTGGEVVHANGELAKKLPRAPRGTNADGEGGTGYMPGVHNLYASGHRPQLADAFSRGRGVHGNDDAGTCEQRRAWLVDWFSRLRDRLRTVRVCCGDWSRVCSSESVTTRLGTTGVFLDPPYSTEAGRDMNLYATDCGKVAHEVRAWCLERGGDQRMRICLAGYEGEGHEALDSAGWECIAWAAAGGYGNRTDKGKANAKRERLWFSPFCVKTDMPLFEGGA
jgi:hypothetical protein